MHKLSLLVLASMALASTAAHASQVAAARAPEALVESRAPSGQPEVSSALGLARDWVLKTSDNICGLRDANQLTHPAQVNYETCLQATPEMKRLRDQKIDPKSAEGIQLRSAGISRVTSACERCARGDYFLAVRTTNGALKSVHCWLDEADQPTCETDADGRLVLGEPMCQPSP